MKKIIERFRDLRYRKRLKKWFTVNIKFIWRRLIRFLCGEKFRSAITSSPAIVTYVAVTCITALSVGAYFFVSLAGGFFNADKSIIRRLSLTEYDESVPYLNTLDMLGSSNRIQVTLKTDDENRFVKKGVDLDRGNINLLIVFSDGDRQEYSLNNTNYDNFEAGATDTFTIILPFGKTPFDISELRLVAVPDIKNRFDDWHCRWARVYFLLGNEPVMIAKETWESLAVFGEGDSAIKQSSLELVCNKTPRYNRASELYTYFLAFNQAGLDKEAVTALKEDTLDAFGLNGGRVLGVAIETANIEVQNNLLTYYTKGVTVPDSDSFDYDGMMYLDMDFYTKLPDGNYSKSFLLDTLGTDDFEMGTTSVFRLEMPEGMTVFDISNIRLRTENPHDAWAPRFVRFYVETDYSERLEIARITDTMLVNSHSTPIFYQGLIDGGVDVDLSSAFCISDAQKKALEQKNGYTFGSRINSMYYKLQSFYARQTAFFAEAVEIYKKSTAVERPTFTPPTVEETPPVEETPETQETPPETPGTEEPKEPEIQYEDAPVFSAPPIEEAPPVETPPVETPPVTEAPPAETPETDDEQIPEGIPTVE